MPISTVNAQSINRLTMSAVLTVLSFATASIAVAQNEVSVVPVTDNIKMLVGRGGNIGLFTGEDGTFMIDDKFADMTEEVESAIENAGGAIPEFLINTHWHGDHTGGNESFGGKGAVIVAHDNVRKRMSVDNVIEAFNMQAPASPKIALPMVTYDSVIRFHINGDDLDVIHVPNAHTDGDSIVHFTNSNVIHTGDLVFNGFFPFIDTDHGGSLSGMIAAADIILGLANDETKIIPGHGPLANKADIQTYRDMLAMALDKLSALRKDGKSMTEAMEMKPLGDLDEQWGKAMFSADKWMGLIYESIPAE